MKTTIKTIILAAASLFAAMSCQKEMAGTQDLVKEGETIQVSINAGLGDFIAADATKATATPVVRLEWESTDKVDAYYGATKISGDARISVTPSENKIFAKLSGTIDASGHTFVDNDIITFVYSNVTGDGLTFDFSNQGDEIPFVAYATAKYGVLTSNFSDKMVEFKFATSVMKIAATNLDGSNISSATIDGINTKVTLAPQTTSEAVNIGGNTSGTITKTAGFDASTDKTRAIFTVGLVPEDANSNRKVTINGKKADLTSNAIAASKSYTTPCAFEDVKYVDYVNIGGKKWATMNLGATTVAGSYTTCYGDLYQWGSLNTLYDGFPWTGPTAADFTGKWKTGKEGGFVDANREYHGNDATLPDANDVVKQTIGGDWRMPTSQEFKALADSCGGSSNYDKTTYKSPVTCGEATTFSKGIYWCASYDGVAGCLFYDGTNRLFFPATGGGDGTSLAAPGYGSYWSSSLNTGSPYAAYYLRFASVGISPQLNTNRYYGLSVRPVSD